MLLLLANYCSPVQKKLKSPKKCNPERSFPHFTNSVSNKWTKNVHMNLNRVSWMYKTKQATERRTTAESDWLHAFYVCIASGCKRSCFRWIWDQFHFNCISLFIISLISSEQKTPMLRAHQQHSKNETFSERLREILWMHDGTTTTTT